MVEDFLPGILREILQCMWDVTTEIRYKRNLCMTLRFKEFLYWVAKCIRFKWPSRFSFKYFTTKLLEFCFQNNRSILIWTGIWEIDFWVIYFNIMADIKESCELELSEISKPFSFDQYFEDLIKNSRSSLQNKLKKKKKLKENFAVTNGSCKTR